MSEANVHFETKAKAKDGEVFTLCGIVKSPAMLPTAVTDFIGFVNCKACLAEDDRQSEEHFNKTIKKRLRSAGYNI